MREFHELGIQEVRTVIGRYGEVDQINGLLKEGWVLLQMYVESFIFDEQNKIFSQRPCYVLGRSSHPSFAPAIAVTALSEEPRQRVEVADEEDLDIETIVKLAGKKPGLKRFGEDFDADL